MQQLQLGLFIYSLISLIAIFFYGWRSFFKFIIRQIIETKEIITLFPSDSILDNPYIMSWL